MESPVAHRTVQKSNLQTHIATHTGEDLQYCPNCPYSNTDLGKILEHRKKYHGPSRSQPQTKSTVCGGALPISSIRHVSN